QNGVYLPEGPKPGAGICPEKRLRAAAVDATWNRMRWLYILFGVLAAWGCTAPPEAGQDKQDRERGLTLLKDAEQEARALTDAGQRTAFWEGMLITEPFSRDSVLQAKIHYQLAGVYYAKN